MKKLILLLLLGAIGFTIWRGKPDEKPTGKSIYSNRLAEQIQKQSLENIQKVHDIEERINGPRKPEIEAQAKVKKPSLKEKSREFHGIRLGKHYVNSHASTMGQSGYSDFSSTIYVFSDRSVSVYKIVSPKGNIYSNHSDGTLFASAGFLINNHPGMPKGTSQALIGEGENRMDVMLGPGDRMPVLINAPCKIDAESVYVDWSQGHSRYFPVADCNSDPEVFTIKSGGLVLASATDPGYTLTLNINSENDDE
jgi:hypothetical protein